MTADSGGTSGGDHTVYVTHDAGAQVCPRCLRPLSYEPIEVARHWTDQPKRILFLGCYDCLAVLIETHEELLRRVAELEKKLKGKE